MIEVKYEYSPHFNWLSNSSKGGWGEVEREQALQRDWQPVHPSGTTYRTQDNP